MSISTDRTAHMVVICTANVIRSPFIAELLRSRLDAAQRGHLKITSAGVTARTGEKAHSRVREIARIYGTDLDKHRASLLTETTLTGRTVVLCAQRDHRRAILQMRPDMMSSVFTVREFGRLLETVRDAGTTPGDWASMVRAAANARNRDRYTAAEDDDIVDPIAQPDTVWQRFEQQSVRAVSSILASAQHLPAVAYTPTSGGREPMMTRREYRQTIISTRRS